MNLDILSNLVITEVYSAFAMYHKKSKKRSPESGGQGTVYPPQGIHGAFRPINGKTLYVIDEVSYFVRLP